MVSTKESFLWKKSPMCEYLNHLQSCSLENLPERVLFESVKNPMASQTLLKPCEYFQREILAISNSPYSKKSPRSHVNLFQRVVFKSSTFDGFNSNPITFPHVMNVFKKSPKNLVAFFISSQCRVPSKSLPNLKKPV